MSNNQNNLRRQLENSGEILQGDENPKQNNTNSNNVTQWDSLKNVPFRGEIENNEEEEMSM